MSNTVVPQPPKFTQLNDLVCDKVGGKIVFATDDWFAVAENLLESSDPEWREGEFTEYGKWMDGWETRRKRIKGHDWCIIQLGKAGAIHGVDIDTSYFTGNYAPKVSVQATTLNKDFPLRKNKIGSASTPEEFKSINELQSEEWKTIVPVTELKPGYLSTRHNYIAVDSTQRWTHLRLNIFPDGGIARFRAYGEVKLDWSEIHNDELVDLAAMENGGVCLGFSNAHYGHGRNLIAIGRAKVMADGWETARRLDRPAVLQANSNGILQVPGSEWALFRLGHPGILEKIEMDTNHFKGNFPDSVKLEACFVNDLNEELLLQSAPAINWKTLLLPQKLSAHKRHYYSGADIEKCGVISHVKITMVPDGGISRMRLWGFKHEHQKAKL